MAEAGQKDQTGNEAVAVEDTAPQTLDQVTGFSSGSGLAEVNPAQEKSKTPEDTGGQPTTAVETSESTAPKINRPEDSKSKPVLGTDEKATGDGVKSKFVGGDVFNEWQEMLLRQSWKVDEIDPEIAKVIKNISQDKKTGALSFNTEHGNFEWGKSADGSEYIGRRGLFNVLTQDLADEEALIAKSRGWKSVNVHGSEANKQKLWLAAMRAGLPVSNYTPPKDSPVLETWKKESAELTGLKNAEEAPKADAPATAEPPKNDAAEAPVVATPTDAAPAVEEVKATEPPKTDAPATAEPPKNDAAEAPVVATPTDAAPAAEEAKAAEPPKTDAPATAEPPKAEEPAAVAAAQEEKPAAPVASKFGTAEPPKAETPKAAEQPKANPAHAEWEERKALYSSKPEGVEVSYEGRMNVESVEGMTKRAATVQDPAHRAGIEKLQDAIKSGKVSVDGPIEREIINNVDSPKGFQKAADYFGKKASSDLGLPKIDAPAAAENTAPQNKAPKSKGPA